jgi:hypothetical protein
VTALAGSTRVTRAASAAGVTFRAVLAAVRAGILSVLAAAAVVVGVADVFGAGWAWIIGGVLGLVLSADWRASRPPAIGEDPPL